LSYPIIRKPIDVRVVTAANRAVPSSFAIMIVEI